MITPSALLNRLTREFQQFTFCPGAAFAWSWPQQTITYPTLDSDDASAQLLHELAHALLGHRKYQSDITLIDMERQAWHYAVTVLAPRYGVVLDMEEPVVQNALDTYRQWLYRRSCCPQCQAVGLQEPDGTYRCLHCQKTWRANEARLCQLRRYSL